MRNRLLLLTIFTFAMSNSASAHFPWLELTGVHTDSPKLECYFSEVDVPDDPALLKYVADAKVWRFASRQEPAEVELSMGEDELSTELNSRQTEAIYLLKKDLGVMTRGDATFRIQYYATTGPAVSSWAWSNDKLAEQARLFIKPAAEEEELTVTVKFDGKPAAEAEIVLMHDSVEVADLKTDSKGRITFDISKQPVDALRVKLVEDEGGEVEGKSYSEVRHYSTMTFPAITYQPLETVVSYPEIPETVTSFGAAIADGALYYYGGHTGGAHQYSNEGQAKTLWKLDLSGEKEWESIAEGPRLQGLAMVADEGKLYRLGGFTAKNEEGEDHDLWSQTSFARFDISTGEWTQLPDLPEPRSSFDAVVLDHQIYVVGGWALQGEEESTWHQTAWKYDLKKENAEWQAIASPPFQRRAVSAAAYQGKLYVIGGMQSSGSPITATAVYNPADDSWADGPFLTGSSMTGFGTSSFAANDRLYVSTYDGTLQRLSKDGQQWEMAGNLPNARFFHRMLPTEQGLLFLGGSSMQTGKFEQVELLKFDRLAASE